MARRAGHLGVCAARHSDGDRAAALAHAQIAGAQARAGATGGRANCRTGARQARSGSGARRTVVQGHHDELTGLLNRIGMLAALRDLLLHANATAPPLAVVLTDLDHFKLVRDQHGHLAGDAVLAEVGRRLDMLVRGDDLIGRYGGEELLALLPGLTTEATHRLEALHRGICGNYPIDGDVLPVTCSIGVTWYRPGETLEQQLTRAGTALYCARYSAKPLSRKIARGESAADNAAIGNRLGVNRACNSKCRFPAGAVHQDRTCSTITPTVLKRASTNPRDQYLSSDTTQSSIAASRRPRSLSTTPPNWHKH